MKKLRNIYEYLSDYSKDEIDSVISTLSFQEKILITDRYGDDLENPVSSSFTREKSNKFYKILIPKIRKLLLRNRDKNLEQSLNNSGSNNDDDKDTIKKDELIELIDNRKSRNEICDCLNINIKQLYSLLLNLKNNGLMLSRKYYSDGSIRYKQVKTMNELKAIDFFKSDRTIITDSKENDTKFLVISDLHFGNSLERLDLIDRAYNYCIKNGINIILCGGDLIDGSYTRGEQIITNPFEQIEYFINNYPSDKNILTFSVAGDHDFSVFSKSSLNIIDVCDNYRHDIIIGGYNNSCIYLKNDQLLLQHKHDTNFSYQNSAPIILRGHSHKYCVETKNNILSITIPPLSNICQVMPSALELNLHFNKGYIENTIVKQIYFGNDDIVLNESTFDLPSNRLIKYEPINNIEPYKSQEEINTNQVQKVKSKQSQIDKFIQRYEK